MQDATLGQHHEDVIDLLARKSGAHAQGVLADVGIVREQPGVGAEDDMNQFFRVGIVFL